MESQLPFGISLQCRKVVLLIKGTLVAGRGVEVLAHSLLIPLIMPLLILCNDLFSAPRRKTKVRPVVNCQTDIKDAFTN